MSAEKKTLSIAINKHYRSKFYVLNRQEIIGSVLFLCKYIHLKLTGH